MRVVAESSELFILLSGIVVESPLTLAKGVELLPADTSHLDLKTALAACSSPDDFAVAAAFIPRTTAQLQISAENTKAAVTTAWNSSHDALLLGALFLTEVGFNLQSNVSAESISADSRLRATNHHFRGKGPPYKLTTVDSAWIVENFSSAKTLTNDAKYKTAVDCLASFRWHTMPRIQLAVLWAGIESLFAVSSEIKFRISLYIARFLRHDQAEQRVLFNSVKKLYDLRSAAVHGSKVKNDAKTAVDDSASLLWELVRYCAEVRALPCETDLVP